MDSLLLLNLSWRINELGEFCFNGKALQGCPYRLRRPHYSGLTLLFLVLTLFLTCCSRPKPMQNTLSPALATGQNWKLALPGSPHACPSCIHSLTPYQQHLLVSFPLTGPSRSWGRSQSGTAESHCTQAERERYMCVRVRKYVGGGRICVYLCICVYLSVCLSARRLLQCYSVARTLDEYNRSKPQG